MRILFLCSSSEPGRDGVGDYVRVLADALTDLGHTCATVALNDPWLSVPLESPDELRLPSALPWSERARRVAAFRESFRPDWTSLQLVPYGFDAGGLIASLPWREIAGSTPLHLMLHEIWIGVGTRAPWLHRLRGARQKRQLLDVITALQPRLITTTNDAYRHVLTRAGLPQMGTLPLVGNLPVAPVPENSFPAVLKSAGVNATNRADFWIGIFFGALHSEWRPEPFLGRVLEAARSAGKNPALVLAGRAGAAGERTWRNLERDYRGRILFIHAGEQPAPVISALLQRADFGIAATPWRLIEKSGSAATMLDHGLPVLVARDDFHLPGEPAEPRLDPLLVRADESLAARLGQGLKRRAPRSRAPDVAAKMVALLEKAACVSG
jgi:hypothetical protein